MSITTFITIYKDTSCQLATSLGLATGHSCQTCLTGLVDRWYQAMNYGSVTGCVTVDMNKAYDLVDINVLLKKRGLWIQ